MTATPLSLPGRRRTKRPLRTLLIGVALLAVLLVGDDVYGVISSSGKAPPALDDAAGPVHIVVELPFEPERYHLERLSSLGSYAGRDGEQNRVRLLRVSQDHLTAIARLPWVRTIEPVVVNN